MYMQYSTHGGQECCFLSVRSVLPLELSLSTYLAISLSLCVFTAIAALDTHATANTHSTLLCRSAERTALSERPRWRESEKER